MKPLPFLLLLFLAAGCDLKPTCHASRIFLLLDNVNGTYEKVCVGKVNERFIEASKIIYGNIQNNDSKIYSRKRYALEKA